MVKSLYAANNILIYNICKKIEGGEDSMVLHVPVSMEKERDQYVVICPVFHVASQGRTEKEALANIIEALELFLEDEDVQKEFADVIKQYTVTEPSMMDLVQVEINDNRKITHLVGA